MNAFNHFSKAEMMSQYAQSKNVPSPKIAIYLTGLLLLLGGTGVLLWIYPEIALFLLLLFLIPVSFKMHAFWSITDMQPKMIEMINFTKNMALVGAILMLYKLTPFLTL